MKNISDFLKSFDCMDGERLENIIGKILSYIALYMLMTFVFICILVCILR